MKQVNYNPDFVYSGIYKAGNFTGTVVIRSCGIEIEKAIKFICLPGMKVKILKN